MPVFLFHGPDSYTQRHKLQFWRAEFEKKHGGDINITIFDGAKTKAYDLYQACTSVPFLGEKRLTIVKDFLHEADNDEQSAMAELLAQVPDFCILVFCETHDIDKRTTLYKKLQKTATVTEFPLTTGSKLLAWIEKEVARCGGSIEKDAALTLAEMITGDLYRLENEIAKLVAYTKGSREITKKDIELLVETQLTASIFRLTDAVGHKDYRLALETLHQLIESGEELHRILYMIMRQFRIITMVKDFAQQGAQRNEIVSQMKEHPFVISNTLNQVQNFSQQQLMRAYELLLSMDHRLKSGGIKVLTGDNREFVLALDRLVLELCR